MNNRSLAMLLLFSAMPAGASNLTFMLSTNSSEVNIRSYVTDPEGVKAGYLEDGTRTATKLGIGFGGERVDDDEDGSPGTETMFNYINPVKLGTYTMTMFGVADSPYELVVEHEFGATDKPKQLLSRGVLAAGQTRTYEVEVADLEHPPLVAKTVSFQTLRQDLQTAAKMSQVGGDKFVAKLDKILAQGEKSSSANDASEARKGDSAVERLRQFVDKLEKAAAGKPDESMGKVKRVVTADALAALGGDAKTLIAKLEKPSGEKK